MLLLTSEYCKSMITVKALCTDFRTTYFSVWRNDPCIATQRPLTGGSPYVFITMNVDIEGRYYLSIRVKSLLSSM